jgi:phospholipid/cholesterol/gamma-HCH transport system permease protein
MIMLPMLYVMACFIGIGGGLLASHLGGYLTIGEFMNGAREFFEPFSAYFGLIKSVTFGFIITSISCYKGYYTRGGAEGVGKSTTQAAVLSCVYILFADLLLATLLL